MSAHASITPDTAARCLTRRGPGGGQRNHRRRSPLVPGAVRDASGVTPGWE